ncbi:MAG: hypothetical protein JSS76_08975 [Bacteroidetes bacterium]|nr:hypothetical protein [Bacteroidota bacterium]
MNFYLMNINNIFLFAGLGDTPAYIIGVIGFIILLALFLRFVLFDNTPKEYKHNPND